MLVIFSPLSFLFLLTTQAPRSGSSLLPQLWTPTSLLKTSCLAVSTSSGSAPAILGELAYPVRPLNLWNSQNMVRPVFTKESWLSEWKTPLMSHFRFLSWGPLSSFTWFMFWCLLWKIGEVYSDKSSCIQIILFWCSWSFEKSAAQGYNAYFACSHRVNNWRVSKGCFDLTKPWLTLPLPPPHWREATSLVKLALAHSCADVSPD